MILKEGGNIFKTDSGPLTQRIATKDVDTTVQFLEIITGYDWMSEKGDDSLPVNYLGTTGRKNDPDGTFEKNSSGDLDLNTDLNKVNKEDIIKRLYDWLIKHGVSQEDIMNKGRTKTDGWIKDAGDQVHFRTPINGNSENGYVQTDFMFTDNPEFQIGSKRGGTQEFSGKDRAVLLSGIARAKGFKYSPKFGLQNAESVELVANDWNPNCTITVRPKCKRSRHKNS